MENKELELSRRNLAEAEEKYLKLDEEYADYCKTTIAEIRRLHEVCRSKDIYIRDLEGKLKVAGIPLPERK